MPTFKLTLAYDGTDFCGWQAQPGQRTVQGELETAWQAITGETVRVTAASRTDSGVHALGQVIGIQSVTRLETEQLLGGINAKLPADVLLRKIEAAPDNFHATHDSIGKRYRYRIHNDRLRPLFERGRLWHVPQPLDAGAMHTAGQAIVGTHDFAAFQAVGSPRESTVRTIHSLAVTRDKGDDAALVTIEVRGDGFLYNMVRIIAGSLVDVGAGRRDESFLAEALASCDRTTAGMTAPAQGLVLVEVEY